jgi:uncharacterized LabA/DUF88 family protein
VGCPFNGIEVFLIVSSYLDQGGTMDRVVAYVDGYNLYHAIKEAKLNRYLWLDIPLLVSSYLKADQILEKVLYFTSDAKNPASHKRQMTYNEALEANSLYKMINFTIIKGRFVEDEVMCLSCQKVGICKTCENVIYFQYEKETDVNIAVQMISDAYEVDYDVAFLITADSDQAPTIKTIKRLFPMKKVVVLFPPGRKSKELSQITEYKHITDSDLYSCQLPQSIAKPGGYILHKPVEWN